MIPEVDVALRGLIEREAAAGTEVEVVFDAPTKDWAGRRNVPTIDVYLYDIREDLRRRERGLINEYAGGYVAARHLPPRHFKLSYLVTAWTQRPEDEHRLLSALLSCFLRHDALPGDLLTGPLAELNLPVPVSVALPPPEDRSFADVWSALGGELKPSLDIVVSAPTDTGQQYVAAPPVVGPPRISLGGSGAWPPREMRESRPVRVRRGAAVVGDDAPAGLEGRAAVGGDGSPAARGGSASGDDGRAAVGAPAGGSVRGMNWGELAASGSSAVQYLPTSGTAGEGPQETPAEPDGESATQAAEPVAGSAGEGGEPVARRSRRASGTRTRKTGGENGNPAGEPDMLDETPEPGEPAENSEQPRPAARPRRRRQGGISQK